MFIYLIENNLNGKVYVGQTYNLQAREKAHFSGNCGCIALQNSINKYGTESFDFVLIEECSSQKELDNRERYWILKLESLVPNGYNIKEGGAGGGPCSEETKEKISQANKGKTRTPEQREKYRQSRLGRGLSEETKQKLRDINLGKKMSPEAIEKTRKYWLGKKHSEESKLKMSQSSKGFKHTEESKAKIREALIGRTYSKETLNRMSVAAQLRPEKNLARKTCKHGHLFTEKNTYRPPGKKYQRQCKTCLRNNAAARRLLKAGS